MFLIGFLFTVASASSAQSEFKVEPEPLQTSFGSVIVDAANVASAAADHAEPEEEMRHDHPA